MINSIISKTFIINSPKLPPEVDFIEKELERQGFKPVRWAIVETNGNELTISASGFEIK